MGNPGNVLTDELNLESLVESTTAPPIVKPHEVGIIVMRAVGNRHSAPVSAERRGPDHVE